MGGFKSWRSQWMRAVSSGKLSADCYCENSNPSSKGGRRVGGRGKKGWKEDFCPYWYRRLGIKLPSQNDTMSKPPALVEYKNILSQSQNPVSYYASAHKNSRFYWLPIDSTDWNLFVTFSQVSLTVYGNSWYKVFCHTCLAIGVRQ